MNNPATNTPVFLTDRQTADRYVVHRNTIHRWARESDFPNPVKLGDNCTRWRLADLESWEASVVSEA